jgi:hypothetical protein
MPHETVIVRLGTFNRGKIVSREGAVIEPCTVFNLAAQPLPEGLHVVGVVVQCEPHGAAMVNVVARHIRVTMRGRMFIEMEG